MADKTEFDPEAMRIFRTEADNAASKVKLLNSFIDDLHRNLTATQGLSLSTILSQLTEMTRALKDQEKNVNAAVLIENKKKIIMNQHLMAQKDITREGKQQLIIENQKLIQQNKLIGLGFDAVTAAKLKTKVTEEDIRQRGGEIVQMGKLNAAARERVRLEQEKAQAVEKYVKTKEGELVKVSEDDMKSGWKDKFKDLGKGVAGQMGLGGLMGKNPWMAAIGILGSVGKKTIEILDLTNRLGAMSQQTTMHWARGDVHLLSVKDKIRDISNGFMKTLDVSAEYVRSLSQAGMSWEEVSRFSENFMAREEATGQSIGDQIALVKEIKNEYGGVNSEAEAFLQTILEAHQTLPMLSLDQVKADVLDLNNGMKAFNTNSLTGVTIYKTLMRSQAELSSPKVGLGVFGGMAQSQRMDFAKTITRMSIDLPTEWKAYFGAQMRGATGKNVAQNILAFEQLGNDKPGQAGQGAFKQFQLMARHWNTAFKDMKPEYKTMAVRKEMEMQGIWSKDQIYQLSKASVSGKLDEKLFKDLQDQLEAQQPSTRQDSKDLKDLLNTGKSISKDMLGYLQKLDIWTTNQAQVLMEGMLEALRKDEISLFESMEPYNMTGALSTRGYWANALSALPKDRDTLMKEVSGTEPWRRTSSDPIERMIAISKLPENTKQKHASSLLVTALTAASEQYKDFLASKGVTDQVSKFRLLMAMGGKSIQLNKFMQSMTEMDWDVYSTVVRDIVDRIGDAANMRRQTRPKQLPSTAIDSLRKARAGVEGSTEYE